MARELYVETLIAAAQSVPPAVVAISVSPSALERLRSVEWAAPSFLNGQSGLHQWLSGEIIVALNAGVDAAQFFNSHHLANYRPLSGTTDQFIVDMGSRGGLPSLKIADFLSAHDPDVRWAEPNFLEEIIFDGSSPGTSASSVTLAQQSTSGAHDAALRSIAMDRSGFLDRRGRSTFRPLHRAGGCHRWPFIELQIPGRGRLRDHQCLDRAADRRQDHESHLARRAHGGHPVRAHQCRGPRRVIWKEPIEVLPPWLPICVPICVGILDPDLSIG